MFYTLAAAANATGLEESTILRGIEQGQIAGAQDPSGEWQIEDVEIQRLYLLVAQHRCSQKYQAGFPTCDRSVSKSEIVPASNTAGIRHQHIDRPAGSPEGSDLAATPPQSALRWENEIRIDDRDKISISDSLVGGYRGYITCTVLVALGCIVVICSYKFFGQRVVAEQKISSSSPAFETPAISKPPLDEQHSLVETVGKIPVIAHGDQPREGPQTTQALHPRTTLMKPDAKTQQIAKKSEPKPQVKPAPETRPTTIKGWTIRHVVDGAAVLEGPNGMTWRVVRGDVVPGIGRVESIVLWGRRWIVATSNGLITTR